MGKYLRKCIFLPSHSDVKEKYLQKGILFFGKSSKPDLQAEIPAFLQLWCANGGLKRKKPAFLQVFCFLLVIIP